MKRRRYRRGDNIDDYFWVATQFVSAVALLLRFIEV